MANRVSTAAALKTKTFGPWRAPGRGLALAGLAGIGLAVIADNLLWGFFCAWAVLLGEVWERGDYPSIVLTPRRLIVRFLPGLQRAWPWDDLGPFVLRRRDHSFVSYFTLLAFSDQGHDLFAAKGTPRAPDWSTAHVRLELNLIIGPSRRAAKACCDDINAWRETYGRPEIDVSDLAAAQAAWNAQQKQREFHTIVIVGGLAFVVPVGFGLFMWLAA